jgi:hypothetical protein
VRDTIQVERTRSSGGLPVAIRPNLTDRALRYQANATPPEGPKQCGFCGSKRNVEIEHVDGFEENNYGHNLMWACRSCNTKKGIAFRNAGAGRRTKQFNPQQHGAQNLAQWVIAVMTLRGESNQMSLGDAIALVHATPQSRRSEFAREIWEHRRARGTDSIAVPF